MPVVSEIDGYHVLALIMLVAVVWMCVHAWRVDRVPDRRGWLKRAARGYGKSWRSR